MRILIVEDEPDLLKALARALRRSGSSSTTRIRMVMAAAAGWQSLPPFAAVNSVQSPA